ncbi:MAG: zinc-ribbon domain-containing protein [Ruminococcus sp.]|nr:zinc-ribbon domain-containing protein [Ruminococcus sp.]
MNCPKCNKNIDGNYTFCPHCGETLGPDVILDRDFLFEETETETVASQRNKHHFRRKTAPKYI